MLLPALVLTAVSSNLHGPTVKVLAVPGRLEDFGGSRPGSVTGPGSISEHLVQFYGELQ